MWELAVLGAALVGMVYFIWKFQAASEELGKLKVVAKNVIVENQKLHTVNNRKSKYVQALEETIVQKLSADELVDAFARMHLDDALGQLPLSPSNGTSGGSRDGSD